MLDDIGDSLNTSVHVSFFYMFLQIAEKKVLKPLLDSLTTPREDVLWNLNALELLKVVR